MELRVNFILEVYVNGTAIPPLYDLYLDRKGVIHRMEPEPPQSNQGLFQLVLEPDATIPNSMQQEAIEGLIESYHMQLQLMAPLANL